MRETWFGVFAIGFIVACGFQILKGTMPWRRAWISALQCVCVVMIYVLVVPSQPETDLGKYADAVSKQIGVEIAAKYKELADADVIASNHR
jgi:hypothetical protein